jgi:type II secretory pathway pseudopilin PulG
VIRIAGQTREPERRQRTAPRSRPQQEGYILLTLVLIMALMAIFALGVIVPIKFEMQRDQEQEMIHRGVQYSRAIRAYYKKFGRYPTKLDDLDNTNNMRYLRKHYKDPINKNQDFRLLHFGEPGVTLGGGFSIGGGTIPGATAAGSPSGMNGSGASGSAFGSSSAFGGSSALGGGSGFGGSSGFGNGSGFGGSGSGSSGVNSSGVFSQSSSFGGNSNSGSGASPNSQTSSGQQGPGQQTSDQQGTNSVPGSDPTQASSQVQGTGQGSSSSSGQQLVAGGPIVGVASVSKNTTIREFNHKKKYNEWQFIYDPSADRGGLITTPYQPALAGFGTQPGLNGQPANTTGTAFGGSNSSPNGSSFGQSSGFGNNANPMGGGGSTSPTQPPANPPQPQ